jgi:aminopeptidase N
MVALGLGVVSVASAQTDPVSSGGAMPAAQAAYDVRFYDLALTVDPEAEAIAGSNMVTAAALVPLSTFILDLDTVFVVTDVADGDGEPLGFERRGGQLWIDLGHEHVPGATVQVRVAYEGVPRSQRFGGFTWAETAAGAPWIAVSCEIAGADLWWPTKDHLADEPDSMRLVIRVPEPLVVAANGVLREIRHASDGWVTYEWFVANPINNYGVSINIAPYETLDTLVVSVSGDTLPVTFWVLPENVVAARHALPEFMDHLRHLEEVAGPYPFRAEKYGIAETPYLGMEHQTIIAYGAGYRNDAMAGIDWGFDGLHQHELAHEWFGNQVTPLAWQDLWLNEGFAQYAQPLYAESRLGWEKARELLALYRARLQHRQAVAPRPTLTAREAYNGDIYFKGALVLHTLRYLIGDEAFFEVLRRWTYPEPPANDERGSCRCRSVTTDDFVALASDVTGEDLTWFFEVYVRNAAPPRLRIERSDSALELRWETPGGLAFPMPVDVEVDGVVRRVDMPEGSARVLLEPDAHAVVDPNWWVLRGEGD